jgi:SAM-dependent methyltransferase
VTYALRLSDAELARYRTMAEAARRGESELWRRAGIGPGARVADVGCGPGAVLRVLGEEVGPGGFADGVDGDPEAVAAATAYAAGLPQVTVRQGAADATGLEPGAYDTVMVRHVLAHNGPREREIVAHLATLLKPGGCLYLVDIDSRSMRLDPEPEPALEEIAERYRAFHAARGNDLRTGLRLDKLLRGAGLDVEAYEGRYTIMPMPPGLRPPPWAARDAMVAEGFATGDDVARWGAAFARADGVAPRPTMFAPVFLAYGRNPG